MAFYSLIAIAAIGLAIVDVSIAARCSAKRAECVEVYNPTNCARPCPKIYRPVCDTKGTTHSNKCVFQNAACKAALRGEVIGIAYPGKCKAPACSICQLRAVAACMYNPHVFIPKCNKDDSFVKKQYDAANDESFCVNKFGTEYEGSRKKGKKANCKKFKDDKPGKPGSPVVPAPQKPPKGYKKEANGIFYKFSGAKRVENRAGAIAACKKDGARLALIRNAADNAIVFKLMKSGHIDGTDAKKEKEWVDSFGKKLTYFKWNRGEPNNLGNEDCLFMLKNAFWNDGKCGTRLPFVCQWKPKIVDVGPKSACLKKRAAFIKKKSGFNPNCRKNGAFAPIQRFGKYSWCTQPNGQYIPNTFKPRNPKNAAFCANIIKIKPKCAKLGYDRFPGDCSRYFRCSPERVFHCTCGNNQFFDFKNERCDYKKNVKCPKKP